MQILTDLPRCDEVGCDVKGWPWPSQFRASSGASSGVLPNREKMKPPIMESFHASIPCLSGD